MNGPSPFAFVPEGGRISCAAFSPLFKTIALLVVALAVGWAWQMWSRGTLEFTWESSGWFAAALCMMLYTDWYILSGQTTLDAVAIEQSWVWRKRVEIKELAYAKLIRVRGLEWLIAPRLYTRTFSNRLTVFYVSGPVMLAEFDRLEKELRTARQASM